MPLPLPHSLSREEWEPSLCDLEVGTQLALFALRIAGDSQVREGSNQALGPAGASGRACGPLASTGVIPQCALPQSAAASVIGEGIRGEMGFPSSSSFCLKTAMARWQSMRRRVLSVVRKTPGDGEGGAVEIHRRGTRI